MESDPPETEPHGTDRRHARYARRLPIRFGAGGRMHGGMVSDISEGGLRLTSPETLPTGTIVDVFVQFPRHAIHLQARIVWTGGTTTGMAFTAPSPALTGEYHRWREAVSESALNTAPQEPATPADPPAPPDPTGPVRRRFETSRGQGYESLIEKRAGLWTLTIHQVPRQPGVDRPDRQAVFRDFAAADRALRDFIREH